jgi:AcrR family transcriptional regulator
VKIEETVMGLARTRKQPEERKTELVETARRVFREKGYAAANVTDIVKEAAVSQGTFYFYFEDKEAVFDAVAETIVLEGYNVIREIATRDDLSALDKIKQTMGFLLAAETVERWTDELAARRLRHMRDRVGRIASELYIPLVTDVVEQGVKEGSLHVLHPVAAASYFVQATLMHLDVLKGSEVLSVNEWWEAYLDFLVKVFGIEENIDFNIGDLVAQSSPDAV